MLGLVIAVLKDTGQENTQVGQTIIAGATVADFAAIVLLTLFFSMSGRGAGGTWVLGTFAGLVTLLGLALSRVSRSMHLGGVLLRLQNSTAEIRVRMSILLLVGFVALAMRFGLEPVFLIALLFVRGVPALLYYRSLGRSATLAAALLQATSLPFLVTAATTASRPISSHRRPALRWYAPGCFR